MNTLTFLPETKTVQAGYMCAESENYKVAACFYHSSFRDINLLKQLYCRDLALFFSFFFWGRRSLQSNSSLYNVNTLRIRVRAVASRPPGKWCRDEYTTLSFFFSPFHWGGGREVEWPVGRLVVWSQLLPCAEESFKQQIEPWLPLCISLIRVYEW